MFEYNTLQGLLGQTQLARFRGYLEACHANQGGGPADAAAESLQWKQLVAQTDQRGYSLVHHAAWFGNVAALEYLASLGADLNVQVSETNDRWGGMTALCYAVRQGHEGAVEWLIEQGVDLETMSAQGHTAASLAVKSGNETLMALVRDGLAVQSIEQQAKRRVRAMTYAVTEHLSSLDPDPRASFYAYRVWCEIGPRCFWRTLNAAFTSPLAPPKVFLDPVSTRLGKLPAQLASVSPTENSQGLANHQDSDRVVEVVVVEHHYSPSSHNNSHSHSGSFQSMNSAPNTPNFPSSIIDVEN